jgi:hypothetical protein
MPSKIKTKTFSFHWGNGFIAEEAQVQGEHNVPTFQLMRYTDGPAEGTVTLRFCQYNHRGMFSRSPLMMGVEEIGMMREALKETPELRALLQQLVED